jgi:hypothetical protein
MQYDPKLDGPRPSEKRSPVMLKEGRKGVTRKVIDLCSNIGSVTDRMTDETKQFTGAVIASKGYSGNILVATAKLTDLRGNSSSFLEIMVFDTRHRPICIPNRSEVIILFEDGSKITESTFRGSCEGRLVVYLGNSLSQSLMKKLKSTKVSAIRVYTGSDYVEADFEPAESKKLFNNVNCMYR